MRKCKREPYHPSNRPSSEVSTAQKTIEKLSLIKSIFYLHCRSCMSASLGTCTRLTERILLAGIGFDFEMASASARVGAGVAGKRKNAAAAEGMADDGQSDAPKQARGQGGSGLENKKRGLPAPAQLAGGQVESDTAGIAGNTKGVVADHKGQDGARGDGKGTGRHGAARKRGREDTVEVEVTARVTRSSPRSAPLKEGRR
jgi:hypothetical protein